MTWRKVEKIDSGSERITKFCLQRAFIPKALILKNEAIKTFDPLAATVHLRILLQHCLLKKFYCKKINNNTRYVYGIKEYHSNIWFMSFGQNVEWQINVECLFWFFQSTWKAGLKVIQFTKNNVFWINAPL